MKRPCKRLLPKIVRFALVMLSVLAGESALALEVRVRDQQNRPLADAVVFASRQGTVHAASNAQAMIDQVDKLFAPRVSAVAAGTLVSFPNKDDIKHHVYSFSPAKTFQLKLYHGVAAEPVMFDKAGLVTIGCNIHDGMVAYLYVVDSPHFGLTDATGAAQFPDLPAGEYMLTAWHYQMEGAAADIRLPVTVPAGGEALELSVAISDHQQLPPPLE